MQEPFEFSLRASPTVSVELKFPAELNSFSDDEFNSTGSFNSTGTVGDACRLFEFGFLCLLVGLELDLPAVSLSLCGIRVPYATDLWRTASRSFLRRRISLFSNNGWRKIWQSKTQDPCSTLYFKTSRCILLA